MQVAVGLGAHVPGPPYRSAATSCSHSQIPVATNQTATSGERARGDLVVVGLSPGTAVITITATEGDDSNSTDEPSPPLEQSVSLDVTVTVK